MAGIWVFEDQTEQLTYVDTHPGSAVYTRWPKGMSLWQRTWIERGVDWLLNAAGAGRERLDAALRVAYPGSRLDGFPPSQSAYWWRLLHGFSVSGGATSELFAGDASVHGSYGGIVIDDSKDETAITGFSGGSAGNRGDGPGGGGGENAGDSSGGGHGGGGQGPGGRRQGRGPRVSPYTSFQALIENSYTRDTLGMGGGGGGCTGNAGGDAGDGVVRMSVTSLTETANRAFTGDGPETDGADDAGGGSGGGYYALVRENYVLGAGITLRTNGGGAPRADGGQGRVTIWYGNSADISAGTVTNASLTTFQMLLSVPFGGSITS